MAAIYADRVKETSTTTGTGAFTLAGAASKHRTFSAGIGANSCYYVIEHQTADEWEVGLGSISGATLTRSSVLVSSNANALVNFSAGTKTVFQNLPAAAIEAKPDVYNLPFTNASLTAGILTVTHNLANKYCLVQIYDNTDAMIVPNAVNPTNTNVLAVDLSSFAPLTGTWQAVVVG